VTTEAAKMSNERAQLARLADAADNAMAAMILAYDEMIFGGDWTNARARIADAGKRLDKALDTANRTLDRTSPRLGFDACLQLRNPSD
jgi:hypothetical protein